jgi:PAT family beta-lactamase induction signal transducer AmpG
MAVLVLMGVASGLPLYLTSRALQAWLRTAQVDLTTIGLFSLVALPYSLKWIWAPLVDHYVPPFLGRRRGWLLILQLALVVAIGVLALQDPHRGLKLVAIAAMAVAFFSASQDIVIDAYRTDILEESERGFGAAGWVLGYRIGLLAAGALAFVLADRWSWPAAYLAMAGLLSLSMVATIAAKEPESTGVRPTRFQDAVTLPFRDFFARWGVGRAAGILMFVVLYKYPDYLAASVATPFLLDLRFSQTDIGAIQGGIGILATIVGAVVGGWLVARIGLARSLWVAGGLQAISNLAYYGLSLVAADRGLLVGAIVAENVCAGATGTVFIAFLMSLCDPRFSAAQYALLSGLMGASRDVLVAPAGAIAESTGWPVFFLITLLVAVPGLLLLPVFAPWSRAAPAPAPP